MIDIKILIIAINYYNDTDTIDFINTFLALKDNQSADLLIIDNSKTLENNPIITNCAANNKNLIIKSPSSNLGYLGAAHWGIGQYLLTNELPEWVILSNTDIEFIDNLFIQRLLSLYPAGFDGIIAPEITSTLSGRNQNPYMIQRPKKHKMYLLEIATSNYFCATFLQILSIIKHRLFSLLQINRDILSNLNSTLKIYAPHGSFIIINKSYFIKGGSLEYGTFLFGEEIFFAESIDSLKLNVVYDQRIKVIHNEHSTIGILKSKKVAKYWNEALRYLNQQYFH